MRREREGGREAGREGGREGGREEGGGGIHYVTMNRKEKEQLVEGVWVDGL